MKPDEKVCPGKYVLHKQHHFVGYEIWIIGHALKDPPAGRTSGMCNRGAPAFFKTTKVSSNSRTSVLESIKFWPCSLRKTRRAGHRVLSVESHSDRRCQTVLWPVVLWSHVNRMLLSSHWRGMCVANPSVTHLWQ